jgi:hypothetical protein
VKYFLIYILSGLLITFIWYKGFEIPNEIKRVDYFNSPPPPPSIDGMIRDTVIYYLENEPIVVQSPQQKKGVFEYINEILTMLIGIINIITFGYQMKDRKSKNEQNKTT